MDFNLESLKQAGAFTKSRVIEREINWLNDEGKEFSATIYIRPQSFVSAVALSSIMAKGVCPDKLTGEIAASIVDKDGNPIFSVEDLTGNEDHGPICDGLGVVLWHAIYEVNRLGDIADPKASALTTSSGATSSSQGSVDEPLATHSET
jgi:hypothetical protein